MATRSREGVVGRYAHRPRLVLAAAWASVLTIPLASAPLFGQGSFLTLPNVFALVAMAGAVVRPRLLRAYRGGAVAAMGGLVTWILVVGLILGPDAWQSVITTYGAIVFFFVGLLLVYWSGADGWQHAVLGGAVASAAIGLLHYEGIVPVFDFEKAPVAARAIGTFQFAQGGYKGLITSSADYDMWLLGGLTAACQWLIEWRSSERRSTRPLKAVFALAAMPVLTLAVLVSQSRAGWLMLAVFFPLVGVAYWASQERRAYQRVAAVAGLFAALLGGLGAWVVVGSGERVAADVVAAAPVTVSIRLAQYPLAAEKIASNPIVGVGHSLLLTYDGYEDVAHNTFLNFGINFGIPAMIALGAACFLVVTRVLRLALTASATRQRRVFGLYGAALVALAIPTSAASGLGSKTLFGLLGVLAGATVSGGFARDGMRAGSSTLPRRARGGMAPPVDVATNRLELRKTGARAKPGLTVRARRR